VKEGGQWRREERRRLLRGRINWAAAAAAAGGLVKEVVPSGVTGFRPYTLGIGMYHISLADLTTHHQ